MFLIAHFLSLVSKADSPSNLRSRVFLTMNNLHACQVFESTQHFKTSYIWELLYYNCLNINYFFTDYILLLLQPYEWQINSWPSNYMWGSYSTFMAKHSWAPKSVGEKGHQNSVLPEISGMFVIFSRYFKKKDDKCNF